jgi:hypothetical protein
MGTIDWRRQVRDGLSQVNGDFSAYLRVLAPRPPSRWAYADTVELAGLEAWGTDLCLRNRTAGVGALVLATEHALPRAIAAAGAMAMDAGMTAGPDTPAMDGAPADVQLERVVAFMDDPTDDNHAAVNGAFDPTRQLHIWDDDLRPAEAQSYLWATELGQLCCAAVLRDGGRPGDGSYYVWPPETCVGRGLVVAARTLCRPPMSQGDVLDNLHGALMG